MSLLSMVEQAVKSCKAEQVKINDNIQLYREILLTLALQPRTVLEDSDSATAATATATATETDTSLGEKEDIELIERALEKALKVRTSAGPTKKDSNKQSLPQSEPGTVVTSKEGMQASAACKDKCTTTRSTCKSASLDRKEHKRPGTSLSSTLGPKSSASYNPGQCKSIINRKTTQNHPASSAGKSQQVASGSPDPGHTSTLHSKNEAIRSNVLSGNDLGKGADSSTPSSNNTAPDSHREKSGAHSLPPQNGRIASDQMATWKSLRRKQNRLWDRVAAQQRKQVPGRSHFMERMRAMFPKEWPCGSPDQTRALVDKLTHQGLDFIQCCQTKALLAKTPEAATELGDKTLEMLQMTAAELQKSAGKVKQEWEAWDRWRPEGGCLCPTGANGVWGNGIIAPLPPTITYTTEAELRELEKLRMKVALLQQEIYLEQVLLDTLSPQLSSIKAGSGCPNISVLRDVYSLLGEGGQCFPAIVLDSEPD